MDPQSKAETLNTENQQLKQDLLVAAEAGQSLLDKNRELKEKCFDYEILKQELEKQQQESYRLEQKLRLSTLSKVDEVEQSKETIQNLVRQHTQEKIMIKKDKEKMRTEKAELIQELKIERSKSDMMASSLMGRGIRPRGARGSRAQSKGLRASGGSSFKDNSGYSKATKASSGKTVLTPSKNDRAPVKKGTTITGTKLGAVAPIKEAPEEASEGSNQYKSKSHNTKNIEALLSMSSVVDESFKDRTFELEREKSKSQIQKLEVENRQLRRKIGELTEEITGYKMYVDMAEKELEEKNNEISNLHDEKILLMEQTQSHSHHLPQDKAESGISADGMSSDTNLNFSNNLLNETGASLADELKQLDDDNSLSVDHTTNNTSNRIKSMKQHNKSSEIKDQIDVAVGILMEIFEMNNLEYPGSKGSGSGTEASSPEKSVSETNDNEGTERTEPQDEEKDNHSLIALLLMLKEISFLSKTSNNLDTLQDLNYNKFNDKAEITTLKETLTRLKTELEMSQEQLVDMIKQKLSVRGFITSIKRCMVKFGNFGKMCSISVCSGPTMIIMHCLRFKNPFL